MRTVFVNPVRGGFSTARRRRRHHRRRRNPFIMNPRNPGLGDIAGQAKVTAMIAAGAAAGAILNRVGLNSITNFYARNGARLLAASVLASLQSRNPLLAIAAAGATIAPMIPEVEMQLASTTVKKNPDELAAELADLLEADLSDGDEVSDGDEMSDGDEVGDEEVAW